VSGEVQHVLAGGLAALELVLGLLVVGDAEQVDAPDVPGATHYAQRAVSVHRVDDDVCVQEARASQG
jgi:hypothetical protein